MYLLCKYFIVEIWVLSLSIDIIALFTYFIEEIIDNLSFSSWNILEPFNFLCRSEFIITIKKSPFSFDFWNNSKWPLCTGLKYPETIMAFLLILSSI